MKLTIKQLTEEIAQRNKQFEKATDAQKRVLVARDVIKQIKQEKFSVQTGCFLEFNWNGAEGEDDLREHLLKGQVDHCRGCAIGALLLSCTLYADKLTVNEGHELGHNVEVYSKINSGEEIENGLNTLFSKEQLILIELAFEQGTGAWSKTDVEDRNAAQNAVDFGMRYDDSGDRLIAIMKNVIKNKGTFKP